MTDADWDVQPRPVSAVGLDDPEYQQVGESLVPTDEPVDPRVGDVIQVFRADLDGDGIEEVLFTFEHVDPELATECPCSASSRSSSLAIPMHDGEVVDDVVYEHVVADRPWTSPTSGEPSVAAILDLNGDGTMEVAIRLSGGRAPRHVFEFRDGALHQVMTSGCGS